MIKKIRHISRNAAIYLTIILALFLLTVILNNCSIFFFGERLTESDEKVHPRLNTAQIKNVLRKSNSLVIASGVNGEQIKISHGGSALKKVEANMVTYEPVVSHTVNTRQVKSVVDEDPDGNPVKPSLTLIAKTSFFTQPKVRNHIAPLSHRTDGTNTQKTSQITVANVLVEDKKDNGEINIAASEEIDRYSYHPSDTTMKNAEMVPTAPTKDATLDVHEKFQKLKYFVLFIGYSRSGSSLTATILDAHKHIVIAHEINVLRGLKQYRNYNGTRNSLFNLLYGESHFQSQNYRAKHGGFGIFNYHIPNTHQGTHEGFLQVIGDKEAEQTTMMLENFPHVKLEKLKSLIKIPIKFIHVIRNPFDIIATKTLTEIGYRRKNNDLSEHIKINEPNILLSTYYGTKRAIEINSRLKKEFGEDVLDINYSKLLQKPRETLLNMCEFLEIACDDEYLTACEQKLYAKETYTRQYIEWPHNIKQGIEDMIKKIDFLQGFQFDMVDS